MTKMALHLRLKEENERFKYALIDKVKTMFVLGYCMLIWSFLNPVMGKIAPLPCGSLRKAKARGVNLK